MSIEQAIQSYLTASPYPLAVQGRVYSHRAPQQPAEPYLIISRVSPRPVHSHSGPSTTVERVMQLSVFGPSQSQVFAISDSLRRLIDGFSGSMDGIIVQSVQWQTDRYQFNDITGMHQFAADFSFRYEE